ncbi:hypothetical protein AYI69_g9872, partial [Smittium culicis]
MNSHLLSLLSRSKSAICQTRSISGAFNDVFFVEQIDVSHTLAISELCQASVRKFGPDINVHETTIFLVYWNCSSKCT